MFVKRNRNAVICACSVLFLSAGAVYAQHHGGGGMQHMNKPANTKTATENVRKGDPYTLDSCPVSGEKLGEMGDSVAKVYNGREVRFCCKRCVSKFEQNKEKYFKEMDAKIIAQQLPYYPMTTCVVSGEAIDGEAADEVVNYVYNNRLVRFCCKGCKKDFLKDPDAYLAKLDKAVIAQQKDKYPLKECMISGEELGEMGEPVDKVYGNRLVRFCCKSCIKDFEANPGEYLDKLDKAWGTTSVKNVAPAAFPDKKPACDKPGCCSGGGSCDADAKGKNG